MNPLFTLVVTWQTHVVVAPCLPENSQHEIVGMVQELRKQGSKHAFDCLECVQGSERNSIPAEFQAFADKYCEEILGAKPTLKWRGYLNPIDYKDFRDNKFMIATAHNTMLVKGRKVIIYFSNLGGCIMIQGIGADVQTSPEEREMAFLKILSEYTSFKLDRTKFESVDLSFSAKIGSFRTVTPRFNFIGRGSSSPFPNKWWDHLSCLTNSGLSIVITDGGLWTNELFKPKGLSPLFRKPDTNLSPLDEAFWKG